MTTSLILLVYCTLILLISLAGGMVPLKLHMTHRRMQLAISLIAGVMLGVGLLHMLTDALEEAPDQPHFIIMLLLAGILTMFFIERYFSFHHHDAPQNTPFNGQVDQEPGIKDHHHGHEHSHAGAQDEVEDIAEDMAHNEVNLNWAGAAIGLTLHTIIAGIALAASVEAGSKGESLTFLAGFGTFLAIFLHKPFDAMTITTLMTVGGWRRSTIYLVNILFSLVIPLGVGLFYLGLTALGGDINLVAYALAFSAGTFLCISLSDLLPELQFHAHDRASLSVALLIGLSIPFAISFLE